MFNDRYGLTQAVLSGRKTQTRRIISCPKSSKGQEVCGFYVYRRMSDNAVLEYPIMHDADGFDIEGAYILPKYKVGEVVAVAQAYRDTWQHTGYMTEIEAKQCAGYSNKMFVSADLMPHHIRITNVRVERLQDISDEDCIKEGVELNPRQYEYDAQKVYFVRNLGHWRSFGCYNFNTPREAYAALIDKISGKGTWESNPYVFVYDFELVD